MRVTDATISGSMLALISHFVLAHTAGLQLQSILRGKKKGGGYASRMDSRNTRDEPFIRVTRCLTQSHDQCSGGYVTNEFIEQKVMIECAPATEGQGIESE